MLGDDLLLGHETGQSGPAAAAEDGLQEGADDQAQELQGLNGTGDRAQSMEGSRGGVLGHCQVKLLHEGGTWTYKATASDLDLAAAFQC